MYSAIVFLPLTGFLLAGACGRLLGARGAQLVTCGFMVVSAALALIGFADAMREPQSFTVELMPWIRSGGFEVDWALRVDGLTSIMLVVVTFVSALVHIYSIGYMSHDPHQPRFFSYLSLFTFAMLILVTSDNFLQMFFGWEGVGLASYLLIGFWYKRPSANAAAIKAFIVNRVGDFGFALGVMAVFFVFGAVDFNTVFAAAPEMSERHFLLLGYRIDVLTAICLLLFMGAMGKSAQFLLHTWLPDAMEGPTPVSALIHAATMVTAGVFLVVRCSPLFELAPHALAVVTIFGAVTAFFAATVGLVQNDIKRVIAYSTCSQLGYMFVAAGLSAYEAAMFHLFTHAFFKALLFLGAGSVIHAMSGEQDMRSMGGLAPHIRKTWLLMIVGTLALTGFPFTAGYFSKDAIIEAAYAVHSPYAEFAFTLVIATALMTSFYSWRLVFLTFHGSSRASKETLEHVHESPGVMLMPLVLLAAGALFAGVAFADMLIGKGREFFWNNAIFIRSEAVHLLEEIHHVPLWVKLAPAVAMFLGFLIAWIFYLRRPALPAALARDQQPLYLFLLNKWYFDELYDFLFVRPAKGLGHALWKWGDGRIIDGIGPDGIAARVLDATGHFVRLQSGYLYHYAFAMLMGVAALVSWFMFGSGQ